jgi:PKD domain
MVRMEGAGVRKAMVAVGVMLAVAVLFGVAVADSKGTLTLAVDANRFAGPTPLRVVFSATTSGATGAVRYRWCFDDGTQGQGQRPTHSFGRAGYYSVAVQAQDESGARVRQSLLLGAWPPKQWAAAVKKPLTKKAALRAQHVQEQRTRKRRKQLERRYGMTLKKCTSQPL